MNVGAHVRGGGQLIPSLEAGVEIGATSVQVFVQSPRQWKPTQYAPAVLAAYREALAAHPSVTSTFSHATYLINLASPDPELYERSVDCLVNNLSVSRGMGASGVVLHVGSHMGAGFDTALPQIARGLARALDAAEPAPAGVDCPILIENAAGTGGTVGRDFGEIEAIIAACGGDERLGLCVDTQHLWASGADYSSVEGAAAILAEIDARVGLDRLRCLHLNDSKVELGANRDRHANIGEGTIGEAGLAPLVGHPSVRDLPLLLEVPGDGDGPRAADVVAAQRAVVRGAALYGATLEMPPPPPPVAKKAKTAKKAAKKTAKKAVAAAPKRTATSAPASRSKRVAAPVKKAPAKVATRTAKKVAKKTSKKTAKKAAKRTAKTTAKKTAKKTGKTTATTTATKSATRPTTKASKRPAAGTASRGTKKRPAKKR